MGHNVAPLLGFVSSVPKLRRTVLGILSMFGVLLLYMTAAVDAFPMATTWSLSLSSPLRLSSLLSSSSSSMRMTQQFQPQRRSYPSQMEEWDHGHVESWLVDLGFGRYTDGFAPDVDGGRLVYLGTEDQVDHIEWQLSLLGVHDESDQRVLGECIRTLVSESHNVTSALLESLSSAIPRTNRMSSQDHDDNDEKDSSHGFTGSSHDHDNDWRDYQI